jgi:hypothetical protein
LRERVKSVEDTIKEKIVKGAGEIYEDLAREVRGSGGDPGPRQKEMMEATGETPQEVEQRINETISSARARTEEAAKPFAESAVNALENEATGGATKLLEAREAVQVVRGAEREATEAGGLAARFRRGPQGELQSAFAKIERKDLGTGTPTTEAARDFARRLGNATDDAGHAIGKNLGGRGGATSGNIFPQVPSINRGAFAQFEQRVARQVEAGKEVYVRVVPRYVSGSTRPYEIAYQVRVDGVTTTRVFPNR